MKRGNVAAVLVKINDCLGDLPDSLGSVPVILSTTFGCPVVKMDISIIFHYVWTPSSVFCLAWIMDDDVLALGSTLPLCINRGCSADLDCSACKVLLIHFDILLYNDSHIDCKLANIIAFFPPQQLLRLLAISSTGCQK